MAFLDELKTTSKRGPGEIVGRLLVDIRNSKCMLVPANIEHITFAASYLGMKSVAELKESVDLASSIVGVALGIIDGKATFMVVGASSLEINMQEVRKPFHSKDQVNKARDILLAILGSGNILAENFKLRMVYL